MLLDRNEKKPTTGIEELGKNKQNRSQKTGREKEGKLIYKVMNKT